MRGWGPPPPLVYPPTQTFRTPDGRSVDTLRQLIDRAYLAVAALDGDRLVGFARVVSDGVLHGSVHDVVVDPACRGQG